MVSGTSFARVLHEFDKRFARVLHEFSRAKEFCTSFARTARVLHEFGMDFAQVLREFCIRFA